MKKMLYIKGLLVAAGFLFFPVAATADNGLDLEFMLTKSQARKRMPNGLSHAARWAPLGEYAEGALENLDFLTFRGGKDILKYSSFPSLGGEKVLYVDTWIYTTKNTPSMRILESDTLTLCLNTKGRITAKIRNATRTGADNNDTGEIEIVSQDIVPLKKWVRVGLAYRAAEGTARLYINGMEVFDYLRQGHFLPSDANLRSFAGQLDIGNRSRKDRGFHGAIAWLHYGSTPANGPEMESADPGIQRFFARLQSNVIARREETLLDPVGIAAEPRKKTVPAPEELRDLSEFVYLEVLAENTGDAGGQLTMQLENERVTRKKGALSASTGQVEPGETTTLRFAMPKRPPVDELGNEIVLEGMRSGPFGRLVDEPVFDARRVERLHFSIEGNRTFRLNECKGIGMAKAPRLWRSPDGKTPFFPFVDQFGQHLHGTWPGKISVDAQFAEAIATENRWFDEHPPPAEWNEYGGWKDGPTLKATGHFRTEKTDGKWWLVDPNGKLYFSHAPAAVGKTMTTRIRGRERYFVEPPTLVEYSFDAANLKRKFGETWREDYDRESLRRLPRWGYNSMGAWTSETLYGNRRIPYTIMIGSTADCASIETPTGYKRCFRDVFDPSFDALVDERAASVARYNDDPYAIGFFLDNEMGWPYSQPIVFGVVNSPADQASKQRLIEMLKKQYRLIGNLNSAWATAYESWDAFADSQRFKYTRPATPAMQADFNRFIELFADKYFSTVKAALQKHVPNKLYLGCRFLGGIKTKEVIAAAARHTDAVSFNLYFLPHEIAKFRLPAGLDAPVIISEWHFGTSDERMFDPGIRRVQVKTRQERAESYKAYMKGALGNPQIVGAHWFRYANHPLTGRGTDGANAHNGLVDVTDTPYRDTVEAARESGFNLYSYRYNRVWNKDTDAF